VDGRGGEVKNRLLISALALLVWAGVADAGGNIKPGQTIHTTFKTTMDAAWDTTISVTASTLDTIQSRGYCSYVYVESLTEGMAFACRAVGSQNKLFIGSTTLGGTWPVVDYKLTTFPSAASEYRSVSYGPLPTQSLYGLIIDGQATGSLYLRFEP
jgi:hypothetical protein